ncbi:MAG: protein kinase [Parachlamydiales bacterium]|nr:protein kinase [Parachlamydiales bacterium]
MKVQFVRSLSSKQNGFNELPEAVREQLEMKEKLRENLKKIAPKHTDWADDLCKLALRAKRQGKDIRLHASNTPLKRAVHINRDGKIYIDMKKSLFAFGTFRKIKQCIDLFDLKVVARKIAMDDDKWDEPVREASEGIVPLDSVARYVDKKGQKKRAEFEPLYKMNLMCALKGKGNCFYAWSTEQKLHFARQLLSGLKTIHETGVHSDIKIENILVDFDEKNVAITDIGPSAGTPTWHSPERVEDCAATKASDIWSMGLVLYMLFYDDHPVWMNLGTDEIYEKIKTLSDDWTKAHLHLNFKNPIDSLIKEMLSINPELRPTAAQAIEIFDKLSN